MKRKPLSPGFLTAVFSLITVMAVNGNNIVFVTSTTHTGNLGGLVGGDSICQQSAGAAGLAGTYRAWLSSFQTSANARLIHSASPYQRVDGMIIASNWTDLVDGILTAPINVNEFGVTVNVNVWTGTSSAASSTAADCSSWLSTASPTGGTIGNSGTIAASWSQNTNGGCNLLRALYCFQQVPNSARISGRVLSSTGRPITHAKIEISSGGLPTPLIYYTDRHGSYSSGDLGDQIYTITPSHRRFTFSPASRNLAISGTNVTNADFTGIPIP
jgi:hypothetical protein